MFRWVFCFHFSYSCGTYFFDIRFPLSLNLPLDMTPSVCTLIYFFFLRSHLCTIRFCFSASASSGSRSRTWSSIRCPFPCTRNCSSSAAPPEAGTDDMKKFGSRNSLFFFLLDFSAPFPRRGLRFFRLCSLFGIFVGTLFSIGSLSSLTVLNFCSSFPVSTTDASMFLAFAFANAETSILFNSFLLLIIRSWTIRLDFII
mmetsp:Transcript_22079/g.32903  ORF Transcript_22079/g.32903 Transcript_22079/m.32903 type:complete len:200 (+) Transcript_22079:305-904(+)